MDVVTCVITMVCVITGKEKEKEEEEGQKSWSHYWLETVNCEPLKCMMLHIMKNLTSNYACNDFPTNSYCLMSLLDDLQQVHLVLWFGEMHVKHGYLATVLNCILSFYILIMHIHFTYMFKKLLIYLYWTRPCAHKFTQNVNKLD